MGEIVAAVGTCHTPYMFTRPPDENPQQLDQAGASMQELGKVLDESRPDVILFFGSDHVETFSVTCVPSFAIISSSRPSTACGATFAPRRTTMPAVGCAEDRITVSPGAAEVTRIKQITPARSRCMAGS